MPWFAFLCHDQHVVQPQAPVDQYPHLLLVHWTLLQYSAGSHKHQSTGRLSLVSSWSPSVVGETFSSIAQILAQSARAFSLKRQCQPQCICLHFTLKVMECQQITIINISLVLCRYNSVKMSKYNHRMVEIYDGLKTKTWITLPMLLFEHCLSAQCIVVDIVPLMID